MAGCRPTITPYHAKYYAHELTKRCAADSMEKLAGTLVDAQVDLNPHQVEAALFAFKSPLSSGAILADDVGLGKTIEAGLVLSQKWAEGKRRMMIVVIVGEIMAAILSAIMRERHACAGGDSLARPCHSLCNST